MRVLVTGAAGFVGQHIVSELALAGHDVFGLDRDLPLLASPGERVTFQLADVRDHAAIERLVMAYQPTHLIHAAAITPSPEDERTRPREIVETNELGTLNVLLAATRAGTQRCVCLSSAAVYAEGPSSTPLTEDAPLRESGGLYALTKLAGERLCRWAADQYRRDVRIVRVGPVYGPYEHPTGSRRRMSHVYHSVELALRGETLYCNDPDAVYDWVAGSDVGQAIEHLLTATTLPRDTYNVAGAPVTMAQLLDAVAAAVPGTRVDWVADDAANLPVPPGYRRAPLDTTALWHDTGYKPAHSIESGIAAYVETLRERTGRKHRDAGDLRVV